MTQLTKKSIDIEKVLEDPHQTWTERLINYVFFKTAIASIYFMIVGWIRKVYASDITQEQWDFAFGGKVSSPSFAPRKLFFLLCLGLIIISCFLALFKKISCFFVWCTLSWLGFVMATVTIIDSLVDRFVPINLAFIMVGIILFFLPLLISLIQYKRKKIEKKLFKKRFLIWIAPLCALFVSLIIFR